MNKDEDRIKHLVLILESYAPTKDAKKLIENFSSNHQTTNAERILELTAALWDGLAYGNWPWGPVGSWNSVRNKR